MLMAQRNTLAGEQNNSGELSVGVRTVRVLHIEDDATIAEVAKEMLEAQGWDVHSCADGNAALEQLNGSAHYDFLLFDYDVPGIDGIELVQRARRLVHRARTPIAVLSANSVEAEAREAGADVFLRKPQDIGSLAEIIGRLLGEPIPKHLTVKDRS